MLFDGWVVDIFRLGWKNCGICDKQYNVWGIDGIGVNDKWYWRIRRRVGEGRGRDMSCGALHKGPEGSYSHLSCRVKQKPFTCIGPSPHVTVTYILDIRLTNKKYSAQDIAMRHQYHVNTWDIKNYENWEVLFKRHQYVHLIISIWNPFLRLKWSEFAPNRL